jgi:hypothetical protein
LGFSAASARVAKTAPVTPATAIFLNISNSI